jgi:hypothetical protein
MVSDPNPQQLYKRCDIPETGCNLHELVKESRYFSFQTSIGFRFSYLKNNLSIFIIGEYPISFNNFSYELSVSPFIGGSFVIAGAGGGGRLVSGKLLAHYRYLPDYAGCLKSYSHDVGYAKKRLKSPLRQQM